MTCNNCTWFVEDDVSEPGSYEHEIAKKTETGFCLLRDLFTSVRPEDKACEDFNDDGELKNGKNDG